jgi:hypothetical protein
MSRKQPSATGSNRPKIGFPECPLLADSVEKVEISDWKTLGLAVTSESVHHAGWFLGSALIFAAWSVG